MISSGHMTAVGKFGTRSGRQTWTPPMHTRKVLAIPNVSPALPGLIGGLLASHHALRRLRAFNHSAPAVAIMISGANIAIITYTHLTRMVSERFR